MSTRRWVLLGDIPILIALILDTELENLSDWLPADNHLNAQDNPNANDKEIEDKGINKDEDKDADLSQVQTSKSMSKISL